MDNNHGGPGGGKEGSSPRAFREVIASDHLVLGF